MCFAIAAQHERLPAPVRDAGTARAPLARPHAAARRRGVRPAAHAAGGSAQVYLVPLVGIEGYDVMRFHHVSLIRLVGFAFENVVENS